MAFRIPSRFPWASFSRFGGEANIVVRAGPFAYRAGVSSRGPSPLHRPAPTSTGTTPGEDPPRTCAPAPARSSTVVAIARRAGFTNLCPMVEIWPGRLEPKKEQGMGRTIKMMTAVALMMALTATVALAATLCKRQATASRARPTRTHVRLRRRPRIKGSGSHTTSSRAAPAATIPASR